MRNLLVRVSGALLFSWMMILSGSTSVGAQSCPPETCTFYGETCSEGGGSYSGGQNCWENHEHCWNCDWTCDYGTVVGSGSCWSIGPQP
jgi:hypothetical protein